MQTKDPGGTTAVGFQHHGGPAESIVTVAVNPRPVSVSLESTGSRLIDEPQAFGEGWRGNDTRQNPRDT